MSSLMLVLLMLVLGSLMLQGISIQHQARLSQGSLEKLALRDSMDAESLLEWGRVFTWPLLPVVQCQTLSGFSGRVCLRLFTDGTALLIASCREQTRWQTATVNANSLLFDRNGWSDFCPRKETLQCQNP
ncbi:DUF2509 family protein [Scandinavium sp. H11S7]|uniref:DUF2509 family protein n=1 Tax=Scandinavium hiltneri TaxID=2926519 RepID=UPI00216568E5|nr:DUF2509 family protein [Scandinavium hiltneri]MCS2156454.1 DUF2509 family protein [Scandinavium hiltneri]